MTKPPEEEQKLCVNCGFCCDNTLFDIAGIKDEEVLPDKFINLEENDVNKRFFRLPCPYFDSKCTIYDEDKPHVCGSFRCELLKEFAAGEVNFDEALQIINEIKEERDKLSLSFSKVYGEILPYRKMYWKLRVLSFEKKLDNELEIIFQKAQLLIFHLGRRFRSKEANSNQFEILENDEEIR